MKFLKSAKRSAALQTCKKLHLSGELNDYFKPNKKYLSQDDLNELLPLWEKNDKADANQHKPGTTKRTYTYKVHVCKFLQSMSLQQFFQCGCTTYHFIWFSNLFLLIAIIRYHYAFKIAIPCLVNEYSCIILRSIQLLRSNHLETAGKKWFF